MATQAAARRGKHTKAVSAKAGPEPDLKAARRLVLELMSIPGTSGHEAAVAEFITRALGEAGAPAAAIRSDLAHRKSPLKGEIGNLIFRLPGTKPAPRRLLMAHLDTVPLCVGSKPLVRGRVVRSGNPASGLGADDRAGCAVVLTAALEILRRKLDHPPLVFFWPVQEEVGLFGAHYGQLSLLGRPQQAFNWDGGPAEKITIGATGAYRLAIEIHGRASHAGAAPERGVSAVTIAGLAIAELQHGGWLGDVRQGDRRGTSNIGVIHGGAATNVVTNLVQLKAEARSHDPAFRRAIVQAMHRAFRSAAASVRSADGRAGKVVIESRLDYESFRLAEDEPCVVAAEAAARCVGLAPLLHVSNGGLDANWMTARGIPTVTLGCGQQDVHTLNERLNLDVFDSACRMALCLATGREGG
ncbi:MAG TPA: M20/M25/M40 family metallo-hydrolase [Pirellulales bacterium]|jgi:tripeptide aminopeptidase|nr:M20/M25/M40 family metallo-hydrolase [Pirellulales bacterium]